VRRATRRTVVAVLLIGAVVGAGVASARYSPLTDANGLLCCSGSDAATSPRFLSTGLLNDGRFSIRVVDIDAPSGTEIRTHDGAMTAGGTPFRPFELDPGQEQWVSVVARKPACRRRPVRAVEIREVTVHWRLFGIPRTTRVALDFDDQVALRVAEHCAHVVEFRQ
jgi:hypothetical protein